MADDSTTDKAPAYSAGDDWWTAVYKLTGYQPPKRGLIFEKLYGNNDIPLMKVEISDWNVEPDLAELSAVEAMSWRTQNSGWRIENTDFIVPFFNGPTSKGSTVDMRKARISLLGTTGTDVPVGGVETGGTFTEKNGNLMANVANFTGWDSRPLAQYSYGGGRALEQLLYGPHHSTWRYAWNDIHVDDAAAVDLTGFDRVANAFDRAAQFFHHSRNTIQDWENGVGTTEDAAWQGQAAGVFWDIIHQLGNIYQKYTDTLPLQGYNSKAGHELRTAKQGFHDALNDLYSTWSTWALYTGNPLRWLHDILLEVTDDIWEYNLILVSAVPDYGYEGSVSWSNEVSEDGFRTNALNKRTKDSYGDLNDLTTWKNIGDEAIKRWQQCVIDQLGNAGNKAMTAVHNAFVGLDKTLQPLTTQSINLQSDYQADKAAAEQAKADAAAAAAAAHEKAMEAKAEQQRADDLAHQKAMEAKAEQQRADDLAHQKAMEDKAAADAAAAAAHQKEMEAKAEQQYKEQQGQAKQQYEQQKQDQQEQEKKQEELQKEQEAKAEQQAKEQMAMQMAMQQQQQKKQDQQQKKQEQLQKEQEQQAQQQYAQQRQDQQAQEAKQQQLQKEQEQQAQQQYAQQQKTQAEYQQKQEEQAKQQYEQQRQDQQAQEAKQQQLQEEQAKQQFEQQKQLQQQLPGRIDQQQLQQQQDQFQHQLENAYGNQTGSQTHLNPDGTVTTDFSDGSSTTINPHTGLETTTHPDGSVTTEHLSHAQTLTNPDGSTSTVNSDGTITTHYPDGSVTTVNPNTAVATTHEPDGQTITTSLGGGATLPHGSSLGTSSAYEPQLHDLPYDGSLGSATPMATEAAIPGSSVSPSGNVLPLGTRIDGTTTGGTPTADTSTMSRGPMGGGMGGMGGMGGGDKSSGERVRQVYEDDDIVASSGGSLGRRSRRPTSYEEETAAGRRTSTAAGYDPYGGGERERTESGDREREAWVPEEEDVWGTDEGGSPAVIG
jgi:hypothetical protein